MPATAAATPPAAPVHPVLAAASHHPGLARVTFLVSALIVCYSLVLHTPGTTRPKKWRMAAKPVAATVGPVERLLAQAKPGGTQVRRKKAKRPPRRLRFAALPRVDLFKAVRTAAAQLPTGIPGMLAGRAEVPPLLRPFLGRIVAAVLPSHAEVLGRRLIRPG